MRIEWIEVENFKGFDKRRFEFHEQFTLIVGENGTGKTSAALAAAEMMRHCVAGVTWVVQRPASGIIRVQHKLMGTSLVSEKILPLRLKGIVMDAEERLEVTCEAASEEALRDNESEATKNAFSRLHKQLTVTSDVIWPLFAFYGAERTAAFSPKANWDQIMTAVPSRDAGYSNWDKAGDSTKEFSEWMGRQEYTSIQENSESSTLAAARNSISKCLPDSSRVWFSVKHGEPVVEWESGVVTAFSQMSDGQKAILTLAGDIARRCALLNPHLEDRAPDETPGVVLIDEIDLHLHPRWQRRIMEDLRRVFPKIQFIATTHSPIIISAAKNAKVIVLDENGSHELDQAYGLDVNWVVEELQGGEARPAEITALISKADDLIEDGKLDEARKIADELRRLQRGPSVDSVRIEATIDNLIALAHAED